MRRALVGSLYKRNIIPTSSCSEPINEKQRAGDQQLVTLIGVLSVLLIYSVYSAREEVRLHRHLSSIACMVVWLS